MNPDTAAELPFRIMFLDEVFREVGDIGRQRNPIEMRDHKMPTGFYDATRFASCPRSIEPKPTLSGDNKVEARIGKTRIFCRCFDVANRDARLAIKAPRFLHQGRRPIQTGGFTAALRETARDRPRSRSQIKRANAGSYDAHRREPIEQLRWKTRAMFCVVSGGFSEIRGKVSHSHFGRHAWLHISLYPRIQFNQRQSRKSNIHMATGVANVNIKDLTLTAPVTL